MKGDAGENVMMLNLFSKNFEIVYRRFLCVHRNFTDDLSTPKRGLSGQQII